MTDRQAAHAAAVWWSVLALNGLNSPWWMNAILLAGVCVALLQTRPAPATA